MGNTLAVSLSLMGMSEAARSLRRYRGALRERLAASAGPRQRDRATRTQIGRIEVSPGSLTCRSFVGIDVPQLVGRSQRAARSMRGRIVPAMIAAVLSIRPTMAAELEDSDIDDGGTPVSTTPTTPRSYSGLILVSLMILA
jgi:hypothetical protein